MAGKKPQAKKVSSSLNLTVLGLSLLALWLGIVIVAYLNMKQTNPNEMEGFHLMDAEEVQAMKEEQKERFLGLVKEQKFHQFTKQDLQFMIHSKEPLYQAIAAQVLLIRDESKEAIRIYEDIAYSDQAIEFSPEIVAVAHNELAQIYMAAGEHQKAITLVQHAIEIRQNDEMLDVWYSLWVEELMELHQVDKAYEITQKCLQEFTSIGWEPKLCLNYMGILEIIKGNIIEGQEYYLRAYQAALDEWHLEDGSICTGRVIPLAFPMFVPKTVVYEDTVLEEDLVTGILPTKPCFEQEWPFYVNANNARDYYTREKFEKMGCYSKEEKNAVLHLITNVEVSGIYQTIVKQQWDGSCDMFVSGCSFGASVALPSHNSNQTYENYYRTPIKAYENVLTLHTLDKTYYHLIVEGMSKLFLSFLHFEMKKIPNLKILASPTDAMLQLAEKLGISDRIIPYEGDLYRYKIKNLYLIEWRILRNLDDPGYHTEEYFVPVLPVVQNAHTQILSQIEDANKRNLVLFCHRKYNSRTIANSKALYQTLEYVSNLFGLQFQLLGENEETLSEQMDLANRAVVIAGVHGSGLANMMYCQKDTAVIEIPVFPSKVSSYSRLASALRFPYYTVPSANISFFDKTPTTLSVQVIQDIEKTLYVALLGQGISPINLK